MYDQTSSFNSLNSVNTYECKWKCPKCSITTEAFTFKLPPQFCPNCGFQTYIQHYKFDTEFIEFVIEKTIYFSNNSLVWALSDTEIGKVIASNNRDLLDIEAEKIKFCNEINDLAVKFIRIDTNSTETHSLVCERIYPFEIRSFTLNELIKFVDDFEAKMNELHSAGIIHNDLLNKATRPLNLFATFPNILLTKSGFKLIDLGLSTLRSEIDNLTFQKKLISEKKEILDFRMSILKNY